jgi:hypothetical protein
MSSSGSRNKPISSATTNPDQDFFRKKIMKLVKQFAVLALTGSLLGCGQPVPPDKAAYVGEWQEKTMYLLITQDGSVRYKRLKGGATVSVEGPLKGFAGDNFEVGIGPMTTTFIVSKPPYRDGDGWRMVVDEVDLVRTSD